MFGKNYWIVHCLYKLSILLIDTICWNLQLSYLMLKKMFPRKRTKFNVIYSVYLSAKRYNFLLIWKFLLKYQYFTKVTTPNFLFSPPIMIMQLICWHVSAFWYFVYEQEEEKKMLLSIILHPCLHHSWIFCCHSFPSFTNSLSLHLRGCCEVYSTKLH